MQGSAPAQPPQPRVHIRAELRQPPLELSSTPPTRPADPFAPAEQPEGEAAPVTPFEGLFSWPVQTARGFYKWRQKAEADVVFFESGCLVCLTADHSGVHTSLQIHSLLYKHQ